MNQFGIPSCSLLFLVCCGMIRASSSTTASIVLEKMDVSSNNQATFIPVTVIEALPPNSMVNNNGDAAPSDPADGKHHYEDPPCDFSDEKSIRIMGIDGVFCSPICDDTTQACTSDVPDGVTGTPICALEAPTGEKYCAILCVPGGESANYNSFMSQLLRGRNALPATGTAQGDCGPMTCQPVPGQDGIGICTYVDQYNELDEQAILQR